MITPEGAVKVLDFGLAAVAPGSTGDSNPANSPTLTIAATQMGMIMGTAGYMSPEQAAGKSADKRADIWSFGVVLWEMLTGRRLFDGETISHTLADVLRARIDFDRLPKHTPASIRNLLRRCLDRDVKTRLRDIGEARVAIAEHLSNPASVIESPVRAGATAKLAWLVAAVLAIALAAALWALWRPRPAPPAAMSQFQIPPPEKSSFGSGSLSTLVTISHAISPNGRLLVFVATNSAGRPVLWLRPLDSITTNPLAGTEEAQSPFWSPDNRSIGFFARGKLNKIDVTGGPVQSIADAPFAQGGTWNRDGEIVFAPRRNDVLYRVRASGGTPTPVTHLDEAKQEVSHGWPFFLPDGRHFLFYSRGSVIGGNTRLYAGSLDSKETKPIPGITSSAMYSAPGYVLFTRESTLMAQAFDTAHLTTSGDSIPIAERVGSGAGVSGAVGLTVSETGTLVYRSNIPLQTHLVWVDRGGRQVGEAAPPGAYNNVELSNDGKHLAFDRATNNTDVWLLDLDRHITSRLTFQQSNVPIWSPDGRTVVFATGRTGLLDLYQRPSNMSSPDEVLLKLGAPPILFPSDWSADGKYLAYYRTDAKTQLDIWVLPMYGDRKPFPYVHGEFNESQGQFSPDGKWMAYVSDESGTPEIYVQSFPTLTGKLQISPNGGSQPRWRPDGKELFYVAPDRKLMAVTVKSGATIDATAPRSLFETTLPITPNRQTYAVSPDGQRFLLNAPLEVASPPMTIVENWTAGLKK
jgi:eukaryotic-like serine/threonine-protein kinase